MNNCFEVSENIHVFTLYGYCVYYKCMLSFLIYSVCIYQLLEEAKIHAGTLFKSKGLMQNTEIVFSFGFLFERIF